MRKFITLIAALFAIPLSAQTVQNCFDDSAPIDPQRAWAIARPWEENTRQFANDQVRLAIMDSGNAGLSAIWLLVLYAPPDGMAEHASCALVSNGDHGYNAIMLEGLEVQERDDGFVFNVPTLFLNNPSAEIPLESDFAWGMLEVAVDTVNMSVSAKRR